MAVACLMLATGMRFAARDHSAATAVELQPLGAQVTRLVEALDYLGAPLCGRRQARAREGDGLR